MKEYNKTILKNIGFTEADINNIQDQSVDYNKTIAKSLGLLEDREIKKNNRTKIARFK